MNSKSDDFSAEFYNKVVNDYVDTQNIGEQDFNPDTKAPITDIFKTMFGVKSEQK